MKAMLKHSLKLRSKLFKILRVLVMRLARHTPMRSKKKSSKPKSLYDRLIRTLSMSKHNQYRMTNQSQLKTSRLSRHKTMQLLMNKRTGPMRMMIRIQMISKRSLSMKVHSQKLRLQIQRNQHLKKVLQTRNSPEMINVVPDIVDHAGSVIEGSQVDVLEVVDGSRTNVSMRWRMNPSQYQRARRLIRMALK